MKDWKRKSILFLVSQNISLFGSSVVGALLPQLVPGEKAGQDQWDQPDA